MCQIYSALTIKTSGQWQVFLLLTLNTFHALFHCYIVKFDQINTG